MLFIDFKGTFLGGFEFRVLICVWKSNVVSWLTVWEIGVFLRPPIF